MGYLLVIGDRTYSSWSLRGWLAFAAFGIPVETVPLPLDSPEFREGLKAFAPARTVPAAKIDGAVVWDSLAIAEMLAERHPEAGHWPADPVHRALARAMAAEMHSGFGALRAGCPMNLRCAFEYEPSEAVRADIARIEALWAAAPGGLGEPWLFGRYSMADAFFAPVAARVAGYGLPVGERAAAYVAAHLREPNFMAWRAEGLREGRRLEADEPGLPERPWPGDR